MVATSSAGCTGLRRQMGVQRHSRRGSTRSVCKSDYWVYPRMPCLGAPVAAAFPSRLLVYVFRFQYGAAKATILIIAKMPGKRAR